MADTTRRWPSVAEIRDHMLQHAAADQQWDTPQPILDALRAWLERFFSNEGFVIERKLSRLTEKLKDAIEQEKFGPLFVDDNGDPIPRETVNDPNAEGVNPTQAYRIWQSFRSIYSMDVLNSVDEEGNLV